MNPTALPWLFGRSVRHLHAVGVGGMGLGPLAIYLAQRGWQVTGEDVAMNPAMAVELQRAGVEIVSPEHVPDFTDLLVHSSAVPAENVSRQTARERGMRSVRRGELLAEVARERRLVVVGGSHGKTTATAMMVAALQAARMKVGYVLGGMFATGGLPPAAVGKGDWLVAEIDESDGTIEQFSPAITLLVNLDWDHPDHYADPAALGEAWGDLIARTSDKVIAWDGCALTAQLLAHQRGSAQTLTFGPTGDYRLAEVARTADRLTLQLNGQFMINEATVQARGDFNALNAAAALAAVQELGTELRPDLLAEFPGVRRRQSIRRQDGNLTVIEDYAHHPAEIQALLQSLRQDFPSQRLVVVFQPHRFSRTRQFKAAFAAALAAADSLHLLDVYGAGESPLPGGTTADLHAEMVKQTPTLPVNYLPDDVPGGLAQLRQGCQPGDCVVFVGAGDIETHVSDWLETLNEEGGALAHWDHIAAELRKRLPAGTRLDREEPLANKTTLRVGGAARIYVEPAGIRELQEVVKLAHARGVGFHLLGRGSNLLVPDTGVEGLVISLRRPEWATFVPAGDGRVRVGAGLRLKNLCGLAAKAGLQGFEFLEGIPGNVGGALRMNAGAMDGWMFDVVESIEIVTGRGERCVLSRRQLHVGYRHCRELQDTIAVGAVLKSRDISAAEDIGRQIDVYRRKRQESQPREPSAGCIFRNPDGNSAGRLIDACGLKGKRIGDAEVSRVHGNFIINRGQASSAEVVELVRLIRQEVKNQTGTELQPEVLLYGARWEDLL